MSVRGFARAALVAGFALPIALGARAQRGPVASTMVTGSPVVTLDSPATDFNAYGTSQGLMIRTAIRYGIEGPALDPSVPQFDFARPPAQQQTLTGLLLGDALDAVARANARMSWSEADGMIVVRVANRGSFLDKRIARYAVQNATPRMALEELIRMLAPGRVSAAGVDGIEATSAQADARMPARTGRDVTFTLENSTVLDVLNRISRENGALSWNVRYDRAPADITTAIILFTESGRAVVAGPPRPGPAPAVQAGRPTGPPAPDLHRVSVSGEMTQTLLSYTRSVPVPLGIERLPVTTQSNQFRPSTVIDLSGVPPATAIAWIVAYDSRFEVAERSGRFLVRPKASVGKPSVLDRPLGSFVHERKAFESVVSDLLRELDADAVPARLDVTRTSLPAGTLDAARRAQISVSIKRATTARIALDTICEAAGSLSWDLREQYSTTTASRSFLLEITSPEGWRFTAPFKLSGAALPRELAPRASIPPEMDRDIARPSMSPNSGPAAQFLSVAAAARLPIGIELGGAALPVRDPRLTTMRSESPADIGPGRLSEILSSLLSRSPELELSVREGVINIAPRGSFTQPEHVLNSRIGDLSLVGVPTSKAIALVRLRMSPAARAATVGQLPDDLGRIPFSGFDRPVTVDLKNPTVRDALNAIVFQNGSVGWTVRYAGADGRAGRVVEEDCVLELWPTSGSAYTSAQVSRSGAWVAPTDGVRITTATSAPPVSTPGTPRAQITLPINTRRLTSELSRWCRGLSVRCSVEVLGPPLQPGPMGPPTGSYDFTGMSPRDAFEKLTTFAPDLEWRDDNGIYRIRARDLPATGMVLDRVVASVDQKIETQNEVLAFVRSLVSGAQSALQSSINIGPISVVSSDRDRPVTLKMTNVTVRQVLDEMARQCGADCSWAVRYTEANGIYPELMFTWSVGTGSSGVTMPIK